MHTGLEEMPDGSERMAAFYAERAAGGMGMIITIGISPNEEGGIAVHKKLGNLVFAASKLSTLIEAKGNQIVTRAVHEVAPDVKFVLQILHMGPLAHNPHLVAPSAVRSRISELMPN